MNRKTGMVLPARSQDGERGAKSMIHIKMRVSLIEDIKYRSRELQCSMNELVCSIIYCALKNEEIMSSVLLNQPPRIVNTTVSRKKRFVSLREDLVRLWEDPQVPFKRLLSMYRDICTYHVRPSDKCNASDPALMADIRYSRKIRYTNWVSIREHYLGLSDIFLGDHSPLSRQRALQELQDYMRTLPRLVRLRWEYDLARLRGEPLDATPTESPPPYREWRSEVRTPPKGILNFWKESGAFKTT